MNLSGLNGWWTPVLVLILIAFAIQQLTVGHNLPQDTALTLLLAGFGAGGVSVAHTAGVNAATPSAPAPTPAPATRPTPVPPAG